MRRQSRREFGLEHAEIFIVARKRFLDLIQLQLQITLFRAKLCSHYRVIAMSPCVVFISFNAQSRFAIGRFAL
jgi:hypothetical protein